MSLKLFHETVADLAQDDLYHADVAVENLQSQGVCRSLKGEVAWSVYCMRLFIQCSINTDKLTQTVASISIS